MKVVEGDSERCEYSIQTIGNHVRLLMKCKGCDERASLLEKKCRNSVIDILLDEPIPDSLILAGLVETLYEDDSVILIHRMADILRKVNQFRQRPTGNDPDGCSRCKRSPVYIFGKIRGAFMKGLPSLYREVKLQSSGLSSKKDQCKDCVRSTKSDLGSLSLGMDELRTFVLRRAFKISGGQMAVSVEPRPLVSGMRRILVENCSVRPCFSSSWIASV
ncbi:MAG: hypothetical protein KAW09_02705, partial [Thermoplasmata archaeon]|nr:hypothetical protein [Thermoplasmata archaeon]